MKIPIWKNTFTNYLSAGTRMLQGILVSRWIISYIGMESYGLWTLFWSFFVYTLLLDCGCGVAAKKYSAGGLYDRDRARFNRVISTVFTFHVLMSFVIVLCVLCASFFLEWILKISDPVKLAYAGKCFIVFGVGAALMFPTGIFPEILVGLQKIYVRNYIVTITKVVEICGTLLILFLGGDLFSLIIFVMAMTLATNLFMTACVFYSLPGLRLKLKIARTEWKEIASFSLIVYLGGVGRMIIGKSSRLLISIFCGAAAVGMFQLSSKTADLCAQAVNQYMENVSPISGALFKRGKILALNRIVVNSMVWNSYAAYGIMLTVFILADKVLLFLWNVSSPEVIFMSRLFIISMYITASSRNVPQSFFIMTERHKFSTVIVFSEGIVNLLLNILLLNFFTVEVILWNSIAIKTLIALFIILPYMVKCLDVGWPGFFWRLFGVPVFSGLPSVVLLLLMRHFFDDGLYLLLFVGAPCSCLLYIVTSLLFLPRNTVKCYCNRMMRHLHKRRAA